MAVRILVSGFVQGVGYRAWLQTTAEAHGLTGWTRNLRDGRVEAVLAGPEDAVRRVSDLARRGPPAARVADLSERPARADEIDLAGGRFRVLPTV